MEHVCNKCGARIRVEGNNVFIVSDGPLCDECIEFVRRLGK
jgi:hypothetical protein